MIFKYLFFLIFSFTLVSCSYQFENGDIPPANDVLFIITSDQMGAASLSVLDLTGFSTFTDFSTGSVHTDSASFYFQNMVYVLNRLGRDNIQILNPNDAYSTVAEISLKSADSRKPNPHSAVFTENGLMYVSLYDSNEIVIIDTITLKKKGSVYIGAYAYNEDKPCPAALYYHETSGKIFTALQRLDRVGFVPSDYSLIITIDSVTNSVINESALEVNGVQYTNPYSKFRFVEKTYWFEDTDSDKLLISCVGSFAVVEEAGKGDGGVIVYDVTDDGIIQIGRVLVSETDTYGDIVDIIYYKKFLYMLTLAQNEDSFFLAYDCESGNTSVLASNSKADTGYLWRIEQDSSGKIYLGDRSTGKPGVRVYDAAAGEWLHEAALDTGLPPYDMVVIEE